MTLTPLPRRAVAPSSNTVPTVTRVRGVVAMLMGCAVMLGCGAALWGWLSEFFGVAQSGGVRWTGTTRQGVAAAALLGTAVALGPLFMVAGWQLFRQGRFSRRVGQVTVALIGVLLTLVFYAKGLFR